MRGRWVDGGADFKGYSYNSTPIAADVRSFSVRVWLLSARETRSLAVLVRSFLHLVLRDVSEARRLVMRQLLSPSKKGLRHELDNLERRPSFNSHYGAILSQIKQPLAARAFSCNSDCFQSARGERTRFISLLDQRI